MKINIFTEDRMCFGIEVDGTRLTAEKVIRQLTDEIKATGYYIYIAKDGRVFSIPWHAITTIEQVEYINDFPLWEPERVNAEKRQE